MNEGAQDIRLREGQRWFVAQTLHNRENLASLHLAAQNFLPFLPRFRKTVRHARKLRETTVPVFPSYIFLGIDLQGDRWRAINGTFGVARLLTAGGRPLPVPEGVVESIIACLDEGGFVRLEAGLKPGQRVSVLSGPFARTIGVLDRLDGRARVRVLLEIMGAVVAVAMDSSNLTAA